jgi:hypothetical protein
MAFGLLTGTSGIQPGFLSSLEALRRALPNNLGAQIGLRSGYRSPEHQADLFRRAVAKYGSVAAARKWVAPPGHSQHNSGNAVDLSYGSPAAMQAAHQMAGQFGLTFPMSYENWHIEPVGARGGKVALGGSPGAAPGGSPGGQVSVPAGTASSSLASVFGGGGSAANNNGIPSISAGGSGDIGHLVGDFSAPSYDLQTMPADAPLPTSTPQATAPEFSPLAGLFALPNIGLPGGEIPPGTDTLPGVLPGQAKQLRNRMTL